jgi:chromosome segregation ATPase
MSDRTTLVQRLRQMTGRHDLEAADELDRLNAQALELCAEISWLRRELAEAREALDIAVAGLIVVERRRDGLKAKLAEARERLLHLVSYTEACEGLLNVVPAYQVTNARAFLAAKEGER